jgi:F-type H+-transporting ATPase subunit a
MHQKTTIKLAVLLGMIFLFNTNLKANQDHVADPAATEENEKSDFDPVAFAFDHVLDAHEVHIAGEGASSITLPLPVILWTENGLVSFLSSAFHHDNEGHHIVKRKDLNFVKYHEKIYQLNAGESHIKFKGKDVSNASLPLDFSITKAVFTMFLVAFLLFFVFFKVARFYKKNGAVAPKGIVSWMEPLVLFVRDDIAEPNIGAKKDKFMPYLLTVFFFILIGNLLGLIPWIGSPNLTGNISVTITLAMFTLIIQLIFSKKPFWKHIFMPPGVPLALYPILVPIEIAGIFIKPAALLIRLFANMTAGHIIVISLISIIFVKESIAWSGLSIPMALFISTLELLVAFLQAYIFTMLSALFIGTAVEEAH